MKPDTNVWRISTSSLSIKRERGCVHYVEMKLKMQMLGGLLVRFGQDSSGHQ